MALRSLLVLALAALIHAVPSSLKEHSMIYRDAKGANQQEFDAGNLNVGPGVFVSISDDTCQYTLQAADANLVLYCNGKLVGEAGIDNGGDCNAPNSCNLAFQTDGNLVVYRNGAAIWNTQTGGRGKRVFFSNPEAPAEIAITDADQKIIWTSNDADSSHKPCFDAPCGPTWVKSAPPPN